MDNEQDLQQFEEFRAGSAEAFAYFYQRYFRHIYVYLLKLTRNTELSKDLSTQTFISLWEYRSKLKDREHLRRYLFAMAHIHFVQGLKTTKTEDEAGRAYASGSDTAGGDSWELVESFFDALEGAIKKLPPKQKLVVELLYFKEIDVRSIAKVLDISEQTVRNHKSEALKFLRKELNLRVRK